MHRLFGLLLLPAVLLFGCSGGGKCPSGSECKYDSCACTEVSCQYYSDGIRVIYMNGTAYTAIIGIDTTGINPIQGHEFTGSDIGNIVTLTSPSNGWTDLSDQSHCTINTFGGSGGQLEGSCTFIFDKVGIGTFNAYMPFSCTLEAAPL